LVEEILDAVDLPGIIRESTGVMMASIPCRARWPARAELVAVERQRECTCMRTFVVVFLGELARLVVY
jgi:hypothetical protein